jgi:hypothetical protein
LQAGYDAAGNLTGMTMRRDGQCLPVGASCWQRYSYVWDEVGRLASASRWDLVGAERVANDSLSDPLPPRTADVALDYGYDAQGSRVRKTATDASGAKSYDLYISPGYELRRTWWTDGDYALTPDTVALYVIGAGVRGRVVYSTHEATPKKYPAFPKANTPVKAPATEPPVPPIDKAGEVEARPPEALERVQAEQLCRSGGCKIPYPNHPLLQWFKPTQSARKVDWGKVAEYAEMMKKGTWKWNPDTAIAVDPNGAIVGGHHRVLAAAVAGVPIPQNYIHVLKSVTARDVISWHEVFGF